MPTPLRGWRQVRTSLFYSSSLADPRVRIREADVVELIRRSPSAFDAILLDVDNGPAGLTRKDNDRLFVD